MSDWIGLSFFVLLIIGVIVGLKVLAKPRTRTTEEFERSAAEGTTGIGASMNALHELMNPEAAKAKEVITQMKEGRYQKKKREGKADADADATANARREREETGDRRLEISLERRATNDEQRTTNNERRTTNDEQRTTNKTYD